MKDIQERIFLFKTEKYFYAFESTSKMISRISRALYDEIQKKNFEISSYPETIKRQAEILFAENKFTESQIKPQICNATINLSSKCNLNCSYCFADKNAKPIKKEKIKEIIDYVVNDYYPDAKGYVFTVSINSEPLLDFDKIEYIESLLIDYEGYLFKETDFVSISPKEYIKELKKRSMDLCNLDESDAVKSLNELIIQKDLSVYFTEEEINRLGDYYYKFYELRDFLPVNKRVQLNRRLIEKTAQNRIKVFETDKFYSVFFMTNGTLLNEDMINRLKGRMFEEVLVSFDGYKEVNDFSRKFQNGNGTHDVILENIKKAQSAGLKVNAACVITPKYTDLISLFNYFISININKLEFHYVRKADGSGFNIEQMKNLVEKIHEVFDLLKKQLKNGDDKLFSFLKTSQLFEYLKCIVNKYHISHRCEWGTRVLFDSDGNIFPCSYEMKYPERKVSDINQKKNWQEAVKIIHVDEFEDCQNCWAKYLCGGTCFHMNYQKYGDYRKKDEVECLYTKSLIEYSLDFFAFLCENSMMDKLNEFINMD